MTLMKDLRLTHPALHFWIDVRMREFGGRWLAVADLGGTPEVGVGETVEGALSSEYWRSHGPRGAE